MLDSCVECHTNQEVSGSNPSLVNFSLFNTKEARNLRTNKSVVILIITLQYTPVEHTVVLQPAHFGRASFLYRPTCEKGILLPPCRLLCISLLKIYFASNTEMYPWFIGYAHVFNVKSVILNCASLA